MAAEDAAPSTDSHRGSYFKQENVALFLSAFGLVADLFDFGVINLVRPMLQAEYGEMTPTQDSMVTGSALVGAILGQLTFGAAADHLGRRVMYISTALLVCLGAVGSSLATASGVFGNVYCTLTFWRFVMGVGIGGEYPLAAASVAENGELKSSARKMALVFMGMGVGQLLGPIVVIVLTSFLDQSLAWRVAFAFGAVLSATCAVLRYFFLEETQGWRRATAGLRTTAAVGSGESYGATANSASQPAAEASSSKRLALSAMSWSLAGTAGAWFLYDIVTYGVGLFSTEIFPAAPGMASAKLVLYINLLGLPGFIGAVILANKVEMRRLQLAGLTAMAICFLAIVATMPSDHSTASGLGRYALLLFGVQRSFDVIGPGVATFTIPGQIFPTRIRATAHGLSAAAGKLGAVVGTLVFPQMLAAYGIGVVMVFMAGMCGVTALWTLVFVPSYGVADLEAIAQHDDDMSVVEQAAKAERILYARNAKGEARLLQSIPERVA